MISCRKEFETRQLIVVTTPELLLLYTHTHQPVFSGIPWKRARSLQSYTVTLYMSWRKQSYLLFPLTNAKQIN